MNIRMISAVLREFGPGWAVSRVAYSMKLKLLRCMPAAECCFEKKLEIHRLDILPDNRNAVSDLLLNLSESQKSSLIKAADDAICGKIQGFSSVLLDYGNPINWHKNPLTGVSCDPKQKWYQIPDFDPRRGDIKVIWEISRFTHFLLFARAYLLTHDKKYYDAFSSQLSDWLSQNPYSYGPAFKCGQECAFRMLNTLLAYNIFSRENLTSREDEFHVKDLVGRCYRKILSNFFYAYRCIRNNHTISELTGMIVGAWCAEDDYQLKKAYRLLDRVIDEQFTRDGGYAQYSFNYQRLALQDLEYVLCVSAATGLSLSEHSKEKIFRSAVLMCQCMDASGDVPNYGANDGALVFPVTACGYRDYRPTVSAVAAILKGKRMFPSGPWDEEFAWFGGRNAEELEQKAFLPCSSWFPDAGLATIRGEDSWAMMILNDYRYRPDHMDQLHFDLWVRGRNVFCDSGTYSYADPKGAALALTGGHNTLKPEKTEQMSKSGAFMVYDRSVRGCASHSSCLFEGTMISKNGYMHSRHVKLQNRTWILEDEVRTSDEKNFEILFHTSCRVNREGGKICLFDGSLKLCTLEGNLQAVIRPAKRSLFYLQTEPVSEIAFCGSCKNNSGKSKIQIEIA